MLAFPKEARETEIKACLRELAKNALALEKWFENLSSLRSNTSLNNTQF